MALGTPDGLRAEIGGEVITISAKDANELSADIRAKFGAEVRVFDGILRIEHADLDDLIDRSTIEHPGDELTVRRLKKRRLALRDMISRLEAELDPPEPA